MVHAPAGAQPNSQAWKKSGVNIELQAPSLKRILEAGQSNKPQASSSRLKKDTFM